MAHVHDQQERRPAVLARHGAGIAVGLVAGTQHGVVPAARSAQAVPLALHDGRPGKQVELAFIGRGARALLGFHDEGTAPVKVDEAARLRAGVDEGHGPLETVIIVLRIRRGGLGGRNPQELRQLDGELLEIGPLAAARGRPAVNEIINVQNRSRLFRDTQADFQPLFHGLSWWPVLSFAGALFGGALSPSISC